jgi:hypothetical protein
MSESAAAVRRVVKEAHSEPKPSQGDTTMTTMTLNELPFSSFSTPLAVAPSKARRWAGRVLTGIPVLFLVFDCIIKFVCPPMVVAANAQLGYQPGVVFPLGLVLATCLAVYLIPRTAIVGAVLLTGYLGGAIATHVRVGDPLFSHVLFPIYVAVLLWGGLYLRDGRLRAVLSRPVRG